MDEVDPDFARTRGLERRVEELPRAHPIACPEAEKRRVEGDGQRCLGVGRLGCERECTVDLSVEGADIAARERDRGTDEAALGLCVQWVAGLDVGDHGLGVLERFVPPSGLEGRFDQLGARPPRLPHVAVAARRLVVAAR